MRTLMFALLFVQGCYTVRFESPVLENAATGTVFHTWTHSFLWGIVPSGAASIDACGAAGAKEIKTQIGGLGLVASIMTVGIWTPMHVKITCARVERIPGGW